MIHLLHPHRWVIASWTIVMMAVLVLYSEVSGGAREIRGLLKESVLLEAEIRSVSRLGVELAEIKREKARLSEQVAVRSAAVLREGETSAVFAALQALAKESHVRILTIGESQAAASARANDQEASAFGALPLTLAVQGKYRDIVRFTSSIETHTYAMRVRSLELAPAAPSTAPVQPGMAMTTAPAGSAAPQALTGELILEVITLEKEN